VSIAKQTIEAIDLPFEQAIAFFAQKTNVTTKSWQDVWEAAHARAFSVAGAATQAIVEDFRRAVTKVIADGMTLGEFRKEFDKIVQTHGWTHTGKAGWRARIIYQTNVATAHAAGRYAQMSEPDALAIRPYWQYVHSGNPHPRLQHKAWDGLTLLADDPWWSTHYPPNGWNCGCFVLPMTARGLARQGRSGPDQAPPLDLRQSLVKKTGETVVTPAGIDPGFAYNPGEAWAGKARLPGNAITAVPVAPPAPALAGSGALAVPANPFADKPNGERTLHEAYFKHAPLTLKAVIARTIDTVAVRNVEGALSNWNARVITMRKEMPPGEYGATWRHEFGHHIDLTRGLVSQGAAKQIVADARKIAATVKKAAPLRAAAEAAAQADAARLEAMAGATRRAELLKLLENDLVTLQDLSKLGRLVDGGEGLRLALRLHYYEKTQDWRAYLDALYKLQVEPEAKKLALFVADYIGAVTRERGEIGFGHGALYYRRSRRLAEGVFANQFAEVFANHVAISGSVPDLAEFFGRIVKRIAPATWEKIQEIINGLS
jgi:hypothetical protein